MTTFLQLAALVVILAAGIGWGRWVWETHRPVSAPESLSPILVHGIAKDEATALADAVAVGIIGRIAEHTRNVAFLNEAAVSTKGASDIRALTRVSNPAPSLIEAARAPEPLDIAIEFAGSKVEAKGLQRLLHLETPKRGALSISLLLDKSATGLNGLASSSFAPNSSYGFAVPIEGNAQEIAERIAMRFVQAHYAAEDSFYSALDPADFRLLWKIRRRAAEIALRASAGSATSADDPLKAEARKAYDEIGPLVQRYTLRPEFQKLGAYLASVSEEFEQAQNQLQLVKNATRNADERSALDRMIAALKTDADARLATAAVATKAAVAAPARQGVSDLEARVLSEQDLIDAGLTALAERVRTTEPARPTEVALVLGAFDEFEPFKGRVTPLSKDDHDPDDRLLSHTQNVAALIATLAPKAKVRVLKALSGSGAGSKADVLAALRRATAAKPDIIVLPIGPFDTKEDLAALQRASAGSLVLVAAGNEGRLLEGTGERPPAVLYVGASSQGSRADYSNFGENVAFMAPGSVLTFNGTGELERMNGTSFSVAVAAAAAANIAALEPAAPAPEALAKKLLTDTAEIKDGRLLQLGASTPR
jgi:hypothetical protein